MPPQSQQVVLVPGHQPIRFAGFAQREQVIVLGVAGALYVRQLGREFGSGGNPVDQPPGRGGAEQRTDLLAMGDVAQLVKLPADG